MNGDAMRGSPLNRAGSWRWALIGSGVLALLAALAFYLQWPPALSLWPWPGGRLSNVFIASILAAAGVPVLWIGLSAEAAAIAGGALNFAVMYSGMALLSFSRLGDSAAPAALLPFAIGCVVLAALCAVMFFRTRRLPFSDARPAPAVVRWAFATFVLILVPVGIALLLRAPAVFPWRLSPAESQLFGCVFIGAAFYFAHALTRPHWKNAQGPLLGFLAYDAVLIGPFAAHFGKVDPALRLSLIVYTGVIVLSAAIALHALATQPGGFITRRSVP
jgi:hypothetical protein